MLDELQKKLGFQVHGNANLKVLGLAPVEHIKDNHIVYVNSFRTLPEEINKDHVLLVNESDIESWKKAYPSFTFIYQKNSRLLFIELLKHFNPYKTLDTKLKLGSSETFSEVHVGPSCLFGENVQIGSGSTVLGNVYIGSNVKIGKNCTIFPGVHIHQGIIIGDNVIIHSGAVLGTDGFGYEPVDNSLIKVPQIGTVVIEDDVEIGANACIDRATLGETRVGYGTKIDNLVQIAHNVSLGQLNIIVSQAGIAGSSQLGTGCIIGGQAGIADHVIIGDGAKIGAQAGIYPRKKIPAQSVMAGTPVQPIQEHLRQLAALKKLPSYFKKS